MSENPGMDRRRFLRNSLLGGASVSLLGAPIWEAAAQIVNKPQVQYINGVGLEDPMLVQLSINENPLGASRRAIEAVAGQMFSMNRYPFHNQLEDALAEFHGVDADMIYTGIGSSEILLSLALAAYYKQGGNTVTGAPSYPSVPRSTENYGGEVKRVSLTDDWQLDLPAMLKAIDSDTRIVNVCNPNNPTGQLLDPTELEAFIRQVPKHAIVCVDEAYIHFVDDPNYRSMISLTKEIDNLLVTRTFSKAYGLGGIRVGYGIAQPELLQRLMGFSVGSLNKNTLSIAAALGALDDQDHVRRTVKITKEGKAYLYAELEALGYKPLRTQTIFVTVDVGPDVESLINRLAERKVKVRQAFDMEGYMRISVGLPHENEAFISAFKNVKSAL
jgi:histidinol-phosphate aminotransferase